MTTAVVLAGGLGTRLRGAVPHLPKPMAKVRGRPFLEYLLEYWIGQGISTFVLSVGYKRNLIMDYFNRSFNGTPIEYVEETTPLGTGGALLLATRILDRPFVLLNGDTFFEVQLDALLDFHRTKSSAWSFSLFRANERQRYGGVEIDEESGQIISLNNARGGVGELANGGVYIVDPNVLSNLTLNSGQSYSLEEDIIPALLFTGCPCFGFESEGKFLDIGLPADYYRAAGVLPQLR